MQIGKLRAESLSIEASVSVDGPRSALVPFFVIAFLWITVGRTIARIYFKES